MANAPCLAADPAASSKVDFKAGTQKKGTLAVGYSAGKAALLLWSQYSINTEVRVVGVPAQTN